METAVFWAFAGVSDQELRNGLTSLLASGYRTEARIVAHIAEVEHRKIHLRDGSASLFDYCVKRLGLSESEAFHRITAARVARRFPFVFTMIEGRQIHLTAIYLLRDHLTLDNHRALLEEASHKTKFQVQGPIARRFPRLDVGSFVRKLPGAPLAERRVQEVGATAQDAAVQNAEPRAVPVPPPPGLPTPTRARIAPI